MGEQATNLMPALKLNELFDYHKDVESSLRLYFSSASPSFAVHFAGLSPNEVNEVLAARLDESDARSSFAVLTSMEAHFRIDFDLRCRKRLKDPLSRHFRKLRRTDAERLRLDEDIFAGWKQYSNATSDLIGQLRGAFKFRHWIAHGRYWSPKTGRKYDFETVHLLATAIVAGFPFVSQD